MNVKLLEGDSVDTIATLSASVERFFGEDETTGALAIAGPGVDAGAEGLRARCVETRFVQGRCGSEAGVYLFCVGLWVPDDYRDEFLAWYECEHAPILLECPTWIGCRFVEERVPNGAQFFALHELLARRALASTQRERSRSTPWFRRLAKTDWFDDPFERRLYRRIALTEGV